MILTFLMVTFRLVGAVAVLLIGIAWTASHLDRFFEHPTWDGAMALLAFGTFVGTMTLVGAYMILTIQ